MNIAKCLREKKCKNLKQFEIALANIASKCTINYGAMGAVGYLYDSVKDEIKWANLRTKFYTKMLIKIGELLVLDNKEFSKRVVENSEMTDSEIANILKSAFLKD